MKNKFYKFVVVGAWSTIINYGVFYIVFKYLITSYLLASAIGFIAGIFAGYKFNRKWTFEVKTKTDNKEIIKYYTVYIVSLALSLLFLKVIVEFVGVDPRIANILAIGLTTCTNFIGIKTVVFK